MTDFAQSLHEKRIEELVAAVETLNPAVVVPAMAKAQVSTLIGAAWHFNNTGESIMELKHTFALILECIEKIDKELRKR